MASKEIKIVGPEQVVYAGKIVEVIRQKVTVRGKEKTMEFARRPPGVRLIIPFGNRMIKLTKEYRKEHGGIDYRLPGGKVFDSLKEYDEFRQRSGDILAAAEVAAIKEAREEVGIQVNKLEHFATSRCGATIIWDLFYFVVTDFTLLPNQELEAGEEIEVIDVTWEEAKRLGLESLQEDRSAMNLLRFLHQKGL